MHTRKRPFNNSNQVNGHDFKKKKKVFNGDHQQNGELNGNVRNFLVDNHLF